MALNVNNFKAPEGCANFGTAKLGTHIARFIGVVALGIQPRHPFKGVAKGPCQQIALTFELLDDFIEIKGEKKPRWISKTVNAFNSQTATLTEVVTALDPEGKFKGDLAVMAHATIPCMVSVVQAQDALGNILESVRIGQITGMPQGIPVPPAMNPPLIFDIDQPDIAMFARLGKFQKEKIKASPSYQGSTLAPMVQKYELEQAQAAQAQAATTMAVAASQPTALLVAQPIAAPTQAQVAQPAPAVNLAAMAPPGFVYDPTSGGFRPLATGQAVPIGSPY